MNAFLQFGFLQRSLLAGLFIALACAVLGVYLILRKDAMIGHGLSHVAFAGVALGLLLNALPLLAALAVSVAAALGVVRLKEKAGLYGDTAIGIVSSLGMALGVLMATLSGKFNVDLLTYLFGEILAIEPLEVWLSLILAILVLLAVVLNYGRLLFMTFDRESARVSGIKIGRLDTLLTILTAVTIVLGMKIVGILLVTALLVLPAATGLQVAKNFRTAIQVSSVTGVASVVLGLLAALSFNLPASASIVIIAFLFFGGSFFFRKKRKLSLPS